ncbi:hypothetical protein [Streptomyces venezuelae]|uniref:hypothetical protein n=1 Tax=Streptomyces venezuelae TaxID=54571 RepID=UPI00344273B4
MAAHFAYLGRIMFDRPVQISDIQEQLAVLRSMEHMLSLRYTATSSGLAGIETTARHTRGGSREWSQVWLTLEEITHRQGRTMEAAMSWKYAPEGRGTPVTGRTQFLRDAQVSDGPQEHRATGSLCDCADGGGLANPAVDKGSAAGPYHAGPFTDGSPADGIAPDQSTAIGHFAGRVLPSRHTDEHPASVLSLSDRPALDCLAPQSRQALTDAAHALRSARASVAAQETYRAQARSHARQATALLKAGDSRLAVLVDALVEQLADFPEPPF